MKYGSMTALSVAVLLALSATASAGEGQTTVPAATPTPSSSTADGNTAQATTEGATASSFESEPVASHSRPAATATGTGSTSVETTAATTMRPTFDRFDADRDGFIARTEVPADDALIGVWAKYDTDNDARIARADFDRYTLTLRPSFSEFDTDRDGFIARTELPAGHALTTSWSEYDTDDDARIARSDFDRYLLAAYPTFAALDKNADGVLTRVELPSAHALYDGFATYDTDRDAKLSPTEFDAYGAGETAAVASTTDDADDAEAQDDEAD
ncbi:MAG TPA: hypothetical protein VND91_08200 [Candidatus Saccharimonadia bacterium]|nr:hypothetical protein [Candidatus Saccharimonadia bacterium]